MEAVKHEFKLLFVMSLVVVGTFGALFMLKFAAVNLGISAGLATNLYFALQWISWGATAAAIVAGFGLGGLVVQIIWAAVKKHSLKTFLTW